jgi:uncharacterized protein (TIGR00255 family)
MLNSMTGYGESEGEVNGVTYAVEIKTVNNRYLKTVVKLPEMAAFLEEAIERFLRSGLSRGTVNYVLRAKEIGGDVQFQVDEKALRAVMEKLGRVASSVDVKSAIDIGGLLNVPGILVPLEPDGEAAERIKECVLRVTEEALAKLKAMRVAEGAALAADLEGNCEAMKDYLERIRGRNSAVLEEHLKRLRGRVNELLSDVNVKLDEETLAREVAILAERSDISEEVARLDYHLEQFMANFEGEGPVGRRLEFISQEMLREANTIASKSSDCEIARCVVEIKCRIDRIKEQVQNVE